MFLAAFLMRFPHRLQLTSAAAILFRRFLLS